MMGSSGMRAILIALAALLSVTLPAAALVPPTSCADAVNEVAASGFSWTPACVRIHSGDAITWTNLGDRLHDLRSSQDDVAALRAIGPHCFAVGTLAIGASATIRFSLDSEGLDASVRQADGTWSAPSDCTLASAPTGIVGEATIPYKCALHPGMAGHVLVRPFTIG